MWESICLTLAAAAGNNIGKVLQKKGTIILPPLSFKLKVFTHFYFTSVFAPCLFISFVPHFWTLCICCFVILKFVALDCNVYLLFWNFQFCGIG